MEWAAARHPALLDVKSGPRVSLAKHAAFKYLLHAERMAAAAQSVALRYLTKRARSCFWLRLFQAYASLQAFKPDRAAWPKSLSVEEYLETVGRTYDNGGHLHRIEY
ncbi:hypothetical protein GPECTOR_16g544 [Gonium pectorale]|uniref:Glycosyl transferase CAP10 domain-containing protein n=1 Tax=Gonium pectorale TaxID=33097 RepID=A0A150GKP6_GONPE|nr:hypothetical protein GPECTOR_16g544 [Gonium pectorale]|eukprot:KXZ50371.1 hypothetical protein GPECTOR_16g544 [Gonium pectorale]